MTWREVALLRAFGRYIRQSAASYSTDYMAQTLVKHAGIAQLIVRLFFALFDPRVRDEAKAEALRGEIETALAKVPNLDEDRIIRRYENLVGAILRTNYFHEAKGDGEPPIISFKIDSKKVEGLARAQALRRDLRLCARCRGRASARRPDRARRHPLVGPSGGFPHRGAWPRQGAEREERGDRAGRRQGRLRAEAAQVGRQPRGDPGRGHPRLQALHLEPARSHRQSRGRCRRAARQKPSGATATIPISSSPPTRARRPSPTPPTDCRRPMASGSTMPSRPAARRATTTRRWPSRRAAPGRR